MADQQLAVKISLDANGLVQGLQVATRGTETAAQSIKSNFAQVAAASGNGSAAMSDFGDKIREVGSRVRSEGRFASFIARDMEALIPVSNDAASAIAGMISGIAYGSALAAAVGGIRLLVSAFHDSGEAADKQLTTIQHVFAETAKTATTAMDAVRKSFQTAFESKTQQEWSHQVDLAREAMKKLDGQIDELVKKKGGAADLFDIAAKAAKSIATDGTPLESDLDKQIRELQEQKDAILHGIEAAHPSKDAAQSAETQHDTKERLDKEALDLANWRAFQLLEGKRFYDAQVNEATKAVQEKFDAAEKDALGQAKLDAENLAEDRKHYKEKEAELDKWVKLQEEQDKKAREQQLAGARELGAGLGAAFSGIITGTESVKQAFAGMAKAAIKAILDVAIKAVEANAVNAASGAAASQASIPIIGPLLAVGAMAAMEATVLGLLSALPSASGGFDIPVGVNPITQLHSGEQVLPRPIADGFRNIIANGQTGGGGDVHITISALDGASVRAFVQSPEFRTAMTEARRLGRAA